MGMKRRKMENRVLAKTNQELMDILETVETSLNWPQVTKIRAKILTLMKEPDNKEALAELTPLMEKLKDSSELNEKQNKELEKAAANVDLLSDTLKEERELIASLKGEQEKLKAEVEGLKKKLASISTTTKTVTAKKNSSTTKRTTKKKTK